MGAGNAFNGSTVAEIYDPSKPVGQRWSAVADSKIWRLYHSIAFLTRNAEVECTAYLQAHCGAVHMWRRCRVRIAS